MLNNYLLFMFCSLIFQNKCEYNFVWNMILQIKSTSHEIPSQIPNTIIQNDIGFAAYELDSACCSNIPCASTENSSSCSNQYISILHNYYVKSQELIFNL